MLAEVKKAIRAKKHPGIDSRVGFGRLARQAAPFVFSPTGKAAPPVTIYWSINSVCNLACKMCDVGMANEDSNFYRNLRIDGSKTDFPIDAFKRIIDEVAPFKPMQAITSTEPLLYRPLGEAIAYTVRKGMKISITTGGYTLINRAEELAEARLSRLCVSIDGPPDLHNSIRGRKNSFERSVEGIKLFREACSRIGHTAEIYLLCTITSFNYSSLVEFYESVADLPVDSVGFSIYNFVTHEMAEEHNQRWGDRYRATPNCIGGENDPKQVDSALLFEQTQEVKRLDAEAGKAVFYYDYDQAGYHRFFHETDQFMTSRRCMVNWFIAEIIADGTMIPYTRCYHVPFGNVIDQPFFDVWNGEKARAWRKELRKQKRFEACKRCALVL